MKKMIAAALPPLFAVFCAACAARTVIPEEILQIPEHSPVYTAYNLWYDSAREITSQNIQSGEILPFGTEITFLGSTAREIAFKRVSDGAVFKIIYDQNRNIIPVEEFIKRLFVFTDESKLAADVRPIVYEKIKRGVVEKGMRVKEALLAYGPPPACRTPSEKVDTWTYWKEPGVTRKLVLFEGKVLEIIELD